MKTTLFLLALLLVGVVPSTIAGSTETLPPIVVSSVSSSLVITNARIDPRDGRIRGTVCLQTGHDSPRLPHVHFYGLSASGRVIAESCDRINGSLLGHTRQGGKKCSAVSASLGNLAGIKIIRMVASAGHKDCNPENHRILPVKPV